MSLALGSSPAALIDIEYYAVRIAVFDLIESTGVGFLSHQIAAACCFNPGRCFGYVVHFESKMVDAEMVLARLTAGCLAVALPIALLVDLSPTALAGLYAGAIAVKNLLTYAVSMDYRPGVWLIPEALYEDLRGAEGDGGKESHSEKERQARAAAETYGEATETAHQKHS